ncbi:carboxymuconolactone decarboxylase family protein [Erwinia sorbitola]|uniref:Carboxymuconolactone decarboxylase family protein n=1 Tax=Erwinia sorbitola TaxID=2681984 RepID=A0A6I6ERN0_9GAMM|nr:carboxymuconolactone decarboxylase family protein [Erwinia sorbitola]MTD27367.1 carboxymuconolactone decarboxylase family protein [Erwinia sorbitola]QGU88906.1 carboxymuconolactone decarboxylase family protein [Erwinia sorbitola]
MTTPLDRNSLASIAPTLAAITEQTLFGTIWQREELNKRERSLITVAALIALGRHQQLPWHLDFARKHGITNSELAEVMTHLAFYCGWPAAVSALSQLPQSDSKAQE